MRSSQSPKRRTAGSARSRNQRRDRRPTLRQAIHDANARAKQRANRRLGRRQGMTSIQAAIADTMSESVVHLGLPQRLLRLFLALLLLPVCYVTTVALFKVSSTAEGGDNLTFWLQLLKTPQCFYFLIGMMLMTGWCLSNLVERPLLYLYVLGHELTHAIFVWICLGKVSSIHVTADGGYIMTNKSNTIIALSPYFVPFWTVVILAISTGLEASVQIPYHSEALYFCIGGSWAFHLFFTAWMIRQDQPDLVENGIFFSIVLIYLANVVLLSALLCLAPGNLSWHHWANHFIDAAYSLKSLYFHLAAGGL